MATASGKGKPPDLEKIRQKLISDQSPIGMPEIAKMLNVSHQTVKSWRRDYRGVVRAAGGGDVVVHPKLLPAPDGPEVPGKPLWLRGTIALWAMQTGRMTPDGTPIKQKPPGRPKRTP